MSDPRKRVHTLLTDAAVAGLSAHEREELELLLAGAAIDPSYEHAAAAIELALVDHTEAIPAGLEAAIVAQASRYYGFTELRPREPTLGGAGGGEVMLGGERSSTGEHDVLESSFTAGRIDEVLAPELGTEGVPDPERDAILRATHDAILRATHDEEDDDEDDDFDLEGDDDDDDDDRDEDGDGFALDGSHDGGDGGDPEPARAKPGARARGVRGSGRGGTPASARTSEDPLASAHDSLSSPVIPISRGARAARWATYVSAVAALVTLGIALWLFSSRDQDPTPEQLQASVESSDDKLEWGFTAKPDPAVSVEAGGSVLWSSELQAGVMVIRGLEANDPSTAQYQLWIVDRDRDGPPVDGGVFDVRAGEDGATEVRVAIDAKLLVSDPAAFVITVERPGGVVVSSQARVAMVAAP